MTARAAPTSVHEAVERAVRGPHQVDQAGLAVADGVRLWNRRGDSEAPG